MPPKHNGKPLNFFYYLILSDARPCYRTHSDHVRAYIPWHQNRFWDPVESDPEESLTQWNYFLKWIFHEIQSKSRNNLGGRSEVHMRFTKEKKHVETQIPTIRSILLIFISPSCKPFLKVQILTWFIAMTLLFFLSWRWSWSRAILAQF
jgi:hypothetical protein